MGFSPCRPSWLSASEIEEFNEITYDKIKSCTDVRKLKRLEKYMREEGFFQTAEVARQMIIDQGGIDPLAPQSGISVVEAENLRKNMESWQVSIRERDAEIQEIQHSKSGAGSDGLLNGTLNYGTEVPELRKREHSARDKEEAEKCEKITTPRKKDIRSGKEYYDEWNKYVSKWEKEDVDEARNEKTKAQLPPSGSVNKENKRKEEDFTSRPLIEREWLANREREKGNDLFQANEYNASLQAYTRAIKLYQGSAAIYANRAAVYLKMHRFDEAYSDCNEALKIDPCYLKALMRRSKASLEMDDPTKALKDCDDALTLDPGNEEIVRLKRSAEAALKKNQERISNAPDGYSSGLSDLPNENTLPGARRLVIEEVEDIEVAKQNQVLETVTDIKTSNNLRASNRSDCVDQKQRKCLIQEIKETEPNIQEECPSQGTELLADEWKVKGNNFFSDGDWEKADECYTTSLNYVPTNATVLSNRSLCRFRLKSYEAAEIDASKAISFDPGFIKAYHHRGMARRALGRLQDAQEDLRKVLETVPDDKSVASVLRSIKSELEQPPLLLPKREGPMIIEEIQDDLSTSYIEKSATKETSSKSLMGLSPNDENVKTRVKDLDMNIHKYTEDEENKKKNRESSIQMLTVGCASSHPAATPSSPGRAVDKDITEDLNPARNITSGEDQGQKNSAFNTPISQDRADWTIKTVPHKPKTALEFERTCLRLLKQPFLLRKYIQNIGVNDYSVIFKEDLSASIMKLMGHFLKENFVALGPMETLKVLLGLSKVKRFKVIMLLFRSHDKEVFNTILELLSLSTEISKDDMFNLKREYMYN